MSGSQEEEQRLRLVLADEEGQPRLTPGLIDRLLAALARAPAAELVTIEGGSGGFCVGLDPEAVAREDPHEAASALEAGLGKLAELLTAIERLPRPVIALVRGPALGGGAGLAAAADLVLASPEATFALPETLMGLIPAIVFPLVARRIGVPRARLMALGARPLTAGQALRWGLVDEVAEDLEAALRRYARRFARMDRRAVAELKALAAAHFAVPAGYQEDAMTRFSHLFSSGETQARLRRFAAGECPWEEESCP